MQFASVPNLKKEKNLLPGELKIALKRLAWVWTFEDSNHRYNLKTPKF